MTLRPYQSAAIEALLARPEHRMLWAMATGAGKSRTAIEAAKRLGAQRVLVVAPALARLVWKMEFQKWAPELTAHTIRFGRNRKNLTKAQVAEREAAYAADIQIISYKLLGEIDASPRDLLIIDEFHALRNPISQQSKIVKAFLRANPKLPAAALSATPIPTDTKNIWNVLDSFWPGKWGAPQRTGDISWSFLNRYCHKLENEYGTSFAGSKSPEALADLGAALAPFIHRVTDAEVSAFTPPLHASPLYIDEKCRAPDIASDWLETGDGPAAIVTYHRELAYEIAAAIGTTCVVTGELTPEQRAAAIAKCRLEGQVLVATSEAIREAISLSHIKRALILEWRTSPAQALQLLGRFARQDSEDMTLPTYVSYVVLPGEEEKARLLTERIQAIQALMAKDRKATQLTEIFQPRPMTEERLDSLFDSMMSTFNPEKAEWDNEDSEF